MVDEFTFPMSSRLLKGRYDDESQVLTLTFVGGAVYSGTVPADVVSGLRGAPSPGAYYGRQIQNRYRMVRQ
jgi:hypothetical protein